MKGLLVLAGVLLSVSAQYYRPELDEYPKPYAFSYESPDPFGGYSNRHEVADGSGVVQGSYTLLDHEGHTRVVDYVADIDGFHVNIRTDEPGTDNQNPANVNIESTAITATSPGGELYRPPHRYY